MFTKWFLSFRRKCRSSHPDVFCKKGVHRNFAKFTGKHHCHKLSFNKVAGFIKTETLAHVFSSEFCEITESTFSYRTPPVTASESENAATLVDTQKQLFADVVQNGCS